MPKSNSYNFLPCFSRLTLLIVLATHLAGAQELAPSAVTTSELVIESNAPSDSSRLATSGSLKLSKTVAPPKVDGVISEGEWDNALKAQLTFQVYPAGDDTPASEATNAFVTYDRDYLYVAFHAFDSDPSAIRGALSKRDSIDADDYVTIFLDTYDDKQRAYYLSVSAQGVQQDGIYTESGGSDPKWDGIFESYGRRTSDGYVVEIAIPFKTLRFKA